MGLLSSIFGGSSSTSTSNSSTNVSVTVNPEITNVIDTTGIENLVNRLHDDNALIGTALLTDAQAKTAALALQAKADQQQAETLQSTIEKVGSWVALIVGGYTVAKIMKVV